MRLRCWMDEPPAYTLDIDVDTRLVLDCPAAVLSTDGSDRAAEPRRNEWLAECADAVVVLISDHSLLGALPVLTEKTSFDGQVLLTRPTAQIGRWVLESSAGTLQRLGVGAAQANRAIDRCETLTYSETVELTECTPGTTVRVTPWSAGRCLGSTAWLIEISRPAAVTAFLYVGAGAVHQLTLIGPASLRGLPLALRAPEPEDAPAASEPPTLRMLRHPRPLDLRSIRESLHRSQVTHLTVLFGGQLRADGDETMVKEPAEVFADPHSTSSPKPAHLVSSRAAAEDDQVGRSALALLKHISSAVAAGGVAVLSVSAAEPLFYLLDLVELAHTYLHMTAKYSDTTGSVDPPPICVVGSRAAAMVAYADTCAEWLCDEKLQRVFLSTASSQVQAEPFAHARLQRTDGTRSLRGAGLVIAEDLAGLSAGGLESGYREPCVLIVIGDRALEENVGATSVGATSVGASVLGSNGVNSAQDTMAHLLRSHRLGPHTFVATEPLSRRDCSSCQDGLVRQQPEEVVVGRWRRLQRAVLSGAARHGKGMIEQPQGAAAAAAKVQAQGGNAAAAVAEEQPAAAAAAAAAAAGVTSRARTVVAEMCYAPVDLRMSRGQCVACLSDLAAPTSGAAENSARAPQDSQSHGQGRPWTIEAVVPRQFAPRMHRRKQQKRTHASSSGGARIGTEELLSLRGVGKHTPPPGLGFWSVVPGAILPYLGGAGDAA